MLGVPFPCDFKYVERDAHVEYGRGGGTEWQCKEGKEIYQGQRIQRSWLTLSLGKGVENSRWKLGNSQCRGSAKGNAPPPSLPHPSASARTGLGLPEPQLW